MKKIVIRDGNEAGMVMILKPKPDAILESTSIPEYFYLEVIWKYLKNLQKG